MKRTTIFEKIEKWYEEANMQGVKLHYENTDAGAWWTADGFKAYFMPGGTIFTAAGGELTRGTMEKMINRDDPVLCNGFVRGKLAGSRFRKIRRFRVPGGYAFAQDKFFKGFPAATCYYCAGPKKPILCGLWDDQNKFQFFAIVMPINVQLPEKFIADEADAIRENYMRGLITRDEMRGLLSDLEEQTA